jgi:acetyl/propionyl-CoA carboxylase alpha subunit
VETNRAFLQRVLASDAYSGGTLSTDFVDRHRQQLLAP